MMRGMNLKIRNLLKSGRLPVAGRDGFTLVEIMMVLLILSLGVLPIAVIQNKARHEVSEADRYTQGIQVAQMHLERIKGMGFGNAANDAGQEGNITWAAVVTNVAFGLDRIEVTATWSTDQGPQTLTLVDLVSMR